MLVAGIGIKGGAVGQCLDGAADDLLRMRLRLSELMFLHGAQAGFVPLESLRITRIIRQGLLRGCFLSHVQNSSCALRNRELLADPAYQLRSKVSLKGWVQGNQGQIVSSKWQSNLLPRSLSNR